MTIEAPPAPQTAEETGIGREQLQKLVCKTLNVFGTMTPSALSRETRLPMIVVNEILADLQKLQYVEARGLAGADVRSELRYAVGGKGHEFVLEALAQSQYVGPAPVSLDDFIAQVHRQTIRRERITLADLQQSLAHLVVPDNLLQKLGPAFNSARSILLYGLPGNGKTSIAEAAGHAFKEAIYFPHCFEVGGQIINFFDPTVHTPVEPDATQEARAARPGSDPRWVKCKRPFVLTGGELSLDMLDLSFNPVSRFYEAPIHLKAIGGVFVVDDFGRQRTDPQSILNRWIVPLERQYDQLTLHTGKKFTVPFDQLVIFSTNIPPEKLSDSGGLRRLYYKILIPAPTERDFRQIFKDVADKEQVEVDSSVFDEFYAKHYGSGDVDPAGHHPRAIIDHAKSVRNFLERNDLKIDLELMEGGLDNIRIQPAGDEP